MEVRKMQFRPGLRTGTPEAVVTFERAGMDYKETISISVWDENYSLDELVQKAKLAIQDNIISKKDERRLECIR